jgi:two-component system, NarL family, response regulator DevR
MSTDLSPTPVFLLIQNRLLREALTAVLNGKGDIRVVGASAFSSDVLLQVKDAAPRVLVMELFASYLEFIREVLRGDANLKVATIGMDADEFCFLQAVRAGASGYLLKDSSNSDLLAAVRTLANGHVFCPQEMCTSLFRYVTRQANQFPSYQIKMNLGLSNREQQLVRLIGRGLTNKEIAQELNLAEQTVRNHVHRTLRKVGADNRLAAVEACRQNGLAV